ncbi:integrase, catalytic region, zinc finger, CCHC-type containing protein [Tanacetum coccineum]
MSNQSEDIQAAGSDTRPPMLDRTDFESWQQRIRDEIATDAKDIWDNVKMLSEGSELTKDDRESQLYDEFKHFRQHKGENIHDFYVRYTKLINDMRHVKTTMPKIQLNSKFVNNMLPEWGRFVTAVKLNEGLKESNHDQLYAYLKQHELHANENKLLMERLNQHSHDPLALVFNYIAGNANAGQGKPIKCYNCNGIGHIARNCTQSKRPQNSDYFKEKMLLMQAQENGVDLDEEQLLFLADGQTHTFDDEVDEGPVQDMAQIEDNIFQADQCDAFDSDVDKAPTAQTMFMANLSSADLVYDEVGPSYDSDTLSEDNKDQVIHSDVSSVPNDAVMIITNDIYEQDAPCVISNNTVNASLTTELARYKELAKMRMIIKDRNVKEESLQKELHSVKMQLNSTLNHTKLIREEV